MKVVILAGGKGTRISEESRLRPKPMVEIGGKPILWHIMRQYASYGFNEFIICCGYKGHIDVYKRQPVWMRIRLTLLPLVPLLMYVICLLYTSRCV